MNKLSFIFCTIAIVILGTLLPVFSNPEIITEKHGNITEHRIATDPIRLAENFYKLPFEEKLKILNQSPDTLLPIYYIAIADEYYANEMKNAGLQLYMLGSLRGMQDTAMCEDYTAKAQIQIYPMLAPNTVKYMINLDNNKLMEIANYVVEWDKQHSTRPNPKWACYHGMQAFMGEVKIKPMNEYPKIQQKFREDFLQAIKDMEKLKK